MNVTSGNAGGKNPVANEVKHFDLPTLHYPPDNREAIANLTRRVGDSGAKRTASPLIPAFSPLRGEGVALGVPAKSNVLLRAGRQPTFVRFRLHLFVEHFKSTRERIDSRYRRAAWCPNSSKTGCAPPSPLNGERAGVRGEAVRLAPKLPPQKMRPAIGSRKSNFISSMSA
jgi:hypothetical protein